MGFRDLGIGIIFLSQTTVGILGNYSLLSHYVALYYNACTLKPIDLILIHLIITNTLLLLSKGVPHTMAAFGLTQFFNDVGCKLLLYVHRVGRSVSVGTICLLSVFQVITISPRNSCWKNIEVKVPKFIALYASLCWSVFIVVNLIFPVYVHAKWKPQNITKSRRYIEFCPTVDHDEITDTLYITLLVVPEVFFSGLMVWSSGSMIVILHRHKQRVQHIHNTHVSSRPSPETRATWNILALVSSFLAIYTVSCILNACIALFSEHNWWLANITVLISLFFPTLGPFIVKNYNHSIKILFCMGKEHNTLNLILML